MAFDFMANYRDENTGWGTYYGPYRKPAQARVDMTMANAALLKNRPVRNPGATSIRYEREDIMEGDMRTEKLVPLVALAILLVCAWTVEIRPAAAATKGKIATEVGATVEKL